MPKKPRQEDPVVRVTLALKASTWRDIEAYRDREGMLTTASATRDLLRKALQAAGERPGGYPGAQRMIDGEPMLDSGRLFFK